MIKLNPLITTVVDGSIFYKTTKAITFEKSVRKIFLLSYYNDEIVINTKIHLYTDERLFELFCIENNFAKYFAKCCNLFIYVFCFAHYDNFSK